MIENQIISKMLDERNIHQVLKHNINKDDFLRLPHVFEYIVNERKEYGEVPDLETVVVKFPEFEYMDGVQESFRGLSARLKDEAGARISFATLQMEAKMKYKELGGNEFAVWMKERFEQIAQATSTDFNIGTDFATNGQERLARYNESKEKGNEEYISLPYGDLKCEVGDFLLIMAYTNRGKSWISSHIALEAWKRQKKNVLYYSPELSQTQQQTRFETLDGHFNNSLLRRGQLENEEEYFNYLDQFEFEKEGEDKKPKLVIKTMEDLPKGLSLDVIEADLELGNYDMVVIDGFNLMNHGKSNDRTSMTTSSRKLRQLFGRHKVLGAVTHQVNTAAEKDNKEEDEAGARIVKAPPIESYSESVALIQDPAMILTFDQHDGVGQLLVAKAREPIVGQTIDLHCDFNIGIIEEPDLTRHF